MVWWSSQQALPSPCSWIGGRQCYLEVPIFTWMKTGPEVSLEACPLWNRRRAKSRCLVPPPSSPPPPSWRGAAALPPAPILMLLDHLLDHLGERWGLGLSQANLLIFIGQTNKIVSSWMVMIWTRSWLQHRSLITQWRRIQVVFQLKWSCLRLFRWVADCHLVQTIQTIEITIQIITNNNNSNSKE